MKLIPFDYNVWAINKDSIECFCNDGLVYSLKQHNIPDGIMLVGYINNKLPYGNKYKLMEWDMNGIDAHSISLDKYNLMMKWKEK